MVSFREIHGRPMKEPLGRIGGGEMGVIEPEGGNNELGKIINCYCPSL